MVSRKLKNKTLVDFKMKGNLKDDGRCQDRIKVGLGSN